MKVLLLQDQVYLPSLGGGNKSNRLLLEELASAGHDCVALCPALTTRAGPTTLAELFIEIAARNVDIRPYGRNCYRYAYNGVAVEALDSRSARMTKSHIQRTIRQFEPDWILVSDDKRRILLQSAMDVHPARVIQIVQTVVHLPFGPLSSRKSRRQTELMNRAHGIVVISDFARRYLKEHGNLEPIVARLPFFGSGPFPDLSGFDNDYLTMINPCVEKGVEIFLSLASHFNGQKFAAVPTWGAEDGVVRSLISRPNVHILPPADTLDPILASTRVLLVPSMWHETFGYIVVEAMLRGIPVVASDIGGLPEAKLGVDYLAPVKPAIRRNGKLQSVTQDVGPWVQALKELISDERAYRRCSKASREAAKKYFAKTQQQNFAKMLGNM